MFFRAPEREARIRKCLRCFLSPAKMKFRFLEEQRSPLPLTDEVIHTDTPWTARRSRLPWMSMITVLDRYGTVTARNPMMSLKTFIISTFRHQATKLRILPILIMSQGSGTLVYMIYRPRNQNRLSMMRFLHMRFLRTASLFPMQRTFQRTITVQWMASPDTL